MKLSLQSMIWSVVLLGAVLAIAFAFYSPPMKVEVVPVVVGDLRVTVQEDGKVRNREKYVVSAPVSGRLSRIQVEPGDEICPEDDLLAIILPSEPNMLDSRALAEAKAKLQAAEASVQRSKANLEEVRIQAELNETQMQRAGRLLESRAIPKDEYDVAVANALVGKQAQRKAKFDSDIASFELEMARAAFIQFSSPDVEAKYQPFEIYAPISGKVLRLYQESATAIVAGTPLIELGDPENLELVVDVLSTDAVQIQKGAEVVIGHWGGDAPLHGVVRVIEPAAFTKVSSLGVEEQRVNVIIDIAESPYRYEALGDGYRVEAEITVSLQKKVLLVPNSAMFRVRRDWHVFKIVEGRVELTKLTVGMQNDYHSQVLEGLDPGDQVVIYPEDKLKSGTSVIPFVSETVR